MLAIEGIHHSSERPNVLLSDASLSSKCALQNQPKSVALNQRMADLPNLGVSFLGPDQFDVILRWFRDYSERGQQIRRQHSVLRSATQGTRLRFQCDLCSTACTKSGHAIQTPQLLRPFWMTAGSAKIRDGRSVFTPGLSSVATKWIDRDFASDRRRTAWTECCERLPVP
jgi:hypothetical protein